MILQLKNPILIFFFLHDNNLSLHDNEVKKL